MTWQDISSAPKDGTRVDLWVHDVDAKLGGYRAPDAYFNGEEFVRWNGIFINSVRDPVTDKWRIYPTHWTPIPDPPEGIGPNPNKHKASSTKTGSEEITLPFAPEVA